MFWLNMESIYPYEFNTEVPSWLRGNLKQVNLENFTKPSLYWEVFQTMESGNRKAIIEFSIKIQANLILFVAIPLY